MESVLLSVHWIQTKDALCFLHCMININIAFSGFPFLKMLSVPWRRLERLNQGFRETLELLWLTMKDNKDGKCSSAVTAAQHEPVFTFESIGFAHVFEWPCKASNPCSIMNKYINNEISSPYSRSTMSDKKMEEWKRAVMLVFCGWEVFAIVFLFVTTGCSDCGNDLIFIARV